MSGSPLLSDYALIDAIENLDVGPWSGTMFRSCRSERNPLQCSASRGRWDDGEFDVLYTSLSLAGSIEEMRFHLGRGQPIIPDKPEYKVYELSAKLERVIRTDSPEILVTLGVDLTAFGRSTYQHYSTEYNRTQELGSVAQFLDADGILVPSARSEASNLIIFCESVNEGQIEEVRDHGIVSQIGNR